MKSVYELPEKNGWGYIVEANGMKVKQHHKPAVSGIVLMTKKEAELFADLVEKSLLNNLDIALTIKQMESLNKNDCTVDDIISHKLDLKNSIQDVEFDKPYLPPRIIFKPGIDGDKLEYDPITDVQRIKLKNGSIKPISAEIL